MAPRSAPTEAEIREAIATRMEAEATHIYDEMADLRSGLDRVATAAADPLLDPAIEILEGLGRGGGWEPVRRDIPGIWRDHRPSEALELRELMIATIEVAVAEAERVIVDHLVASALAFAAQHPSAPRGRYQWRPDRYRSAFDPDAPAPDD